MKYLNKEIQPIAIFLTLAIISLVSCEMQHNNNSNEATTSQVDDNIISVEVVKPERRSFNSDISITGTVRSDKKVMIHSMESGMLESIRVDIGDYVKKGSEIARLKNPMLTYELKNAELQVQEANSETAELKALESQYKKAYEIKKGMLERLEEAYQKSPGLVTLTEIDKAKGEAENAKSFLDVTKAKTQGVQAKINTANALLDAYKERNSFLTIKAPFSGIITARYIDPGAMVQSALHNENAKPLVNLESLNPVRVIIPLPETDVASVKKGNSVQVEFPTLPGKNIDAKISRISSSLDPSSKTMEVQINLPNSSGEIRPGMYAKILMDLTSRSDVLSLPKQAIFNHKDSPHYMTVVNDIVQVKPLKKGLQGRDYFEVLNMEIDQSSLIITSGKSLVKDGQIVKAILK